MLKFHLLRLCFPVDLCRLDLFSLVSQYCGNSRDFEDIFMVPGSLRKVNWICKSEIELISVLVWTDVFFQPLMKKYYIVSLWIFSLLIFIDLLWIFFVLLWIFLESSFLVQYLFVEPLLLGSSFFGFTSFTSKYMQKFAIYLSFSIYIILFLVSIFFSFYQTQLNM